MKQILKGIHEFAIFRVELHGFPSIHSFLFVRCLDCSDAVWIFELKKQKNEGSVSCLNNNSHHKCKKSVEHCCNTPQTVPSFRMEIRIRQTKSLAGFESSIRSQDKDRRRFEGVSEIWSCKFGSPQRKTQVLWRKSDNSMVFPAFKWCSGLSIDNEVPLQQQELGKF